MCLCFPASQSDTFYICYEGSKLASNSEGGTIRYFEASWCKSKNAPMAEWQTQRTWIWIEVS